MKKPHNLLFVAIKNHKSGDFLIAKRQYKTILAHTSDKSTLYMLGLLESQLKNFTSAITELEQSISPETLTADFYNALAICYQESGHQKVAYNLINIAVCKSPDNPFFRNRKTGILISAKKYEKALIISRQLIEKHNNFLPAYLSSATIHFKMNRPDNSLRVLKKCIHIFPDSGDAFFRLAEAYMYAGCPNQASRILETLLRSSFKTIECLNNLGNIGRDLGDFGRANTYYQRALQLHPGHNIILWNISLLHLLKGEYSTGFNLYENRLSLIKKSEKLIAPEWNGQSLFKKSLLIIKEQGLGDQILFSQNYRSLIQKCRQLYIQCDERLLEIFTQTFPDAICFSELKSGAVQIHKIDYYIYAGSVLKSHNVKPEKKYIELKSTTFNKHSLSRTNPKKLNIGFSWKGAINFKDYRKRSTHLRDWQNILKQSQFSFHCLQHNISETEKNTLIKISPTIKIYSSISADNNIDILASIISEMDIIISVTNTTVHIAGALGIPTWCLTPKVPEWPWGTIDEQCYWYDSVSHVRQKTHNSWQPVFSEIIEKLESLHKNR